MNDEKTAAKALLDMNSPHTTSNTDTIGFVGERSDGKRRIKRDIYDIASSSSPDATRESTRREATDPPPKKRRKRIQEPEYTFEVQPRIIQVCRVPKTEVDHTYRDFSSVPPCTGYQPPESLSEMSFAQKLHLMLSSPDSQGAVEWLPNGRAFKIICPNALEKNKLLLKYLGHNRYSKFLSQLKFYRLKTLTVGKDAGAYYHEFMLRGLPHLAMYMPIGKHERRKNPDPENEPDLDTVSMLWPLKGPAQPGTVPCDKPSVSQIPVSILNAVQSTQPATLARAASIPTLQHSMQAPPQVRPQPARPVASPSQPSNGNLALDNAMMFSLVGGLVLHQAEQKRKEEQEERRRAEQARALLQQLTSLQAQPYTLSNSRLASSEQAMANQNSSVVAALVAELLKK